MGFSIKAKSSVNKQLAEKTAAKRKSNVSATALLQAASSRAIANDLVPALHIQRVPINDLRSPARRIRRAGKQHVANVIKSIKIAGQVFPVLIDRDGVIINGNVIVEALKESGETHVNVVCLDHLDDKQIQFLRIALNKLSEGSTWDLLELKAEFEELRLSGFDLTGTGFTLPEIDIIMSDQEPNVPEPPDLEPPEEPVTRLGDLWELGPHRLLCGNALDEPCYALLFPHGEKAAACFTDPPWNVPIEGFVSSKHKDFKMAVGEMDAESFQAFADEAHQRIADAISTQAVVFSCIDWRSLHVFIAAAEKASLTHINTAVWNKGSGGMGGLYRSGHELIPVFCKGKTPHTNNVQLGKHGRDRTNVWTYPGANRPGSSAGKALKHHPTPKPLEMVADALLDVTSRGDLVLDPFMGSGTTLLAAEKTGRIAAGIELDPAYVDVCIRRWQELTGCRAVHSKSRLSFDELAQQRERTDIELEGEACDDDDE